MDSADRRCDDLVMAMTGNVTRSEVDRILDQTRWCREVSPTELDAVSDSRTRDGVEVLGVAGRGDITFTVFNVLTYTIHKPLAVKGYLQQEHPEVYDNSPLSGGWPDAYRLDWLEEDRGSGYYALESEAVVEVAQTMTAFEGMVADSGSDAVESHSRILRKNPGVFTAEIGPLFPHGTSVYRGGRMPVKLVPDEQRQSDAMSW